MQPSISPAVLSSLLFLCASSCILDQMGTAASDGDSDTDTDLDGDADLDEDLDVEEDAEPDVEEDAEPDVEQDAEPDGDVAFGVVSVVEPVAYTCGWLLDPRPRDQKDVVISFEGLPSGESIQSVRLGSMDMEYCTVDPQEGCITNLVTSGNRGSVSLHPPAVSAEQELEVAVISETGSATWDGRFEYRVLDVELQIEPAANAGPSAVSALVTGRCGAAERMGFGCAIDGSDVAIALEAPHDGGTLRLVRAIDPPGRTSVMTTWHGDADHGVLAMGRIYARRSASSSYAADVASIGTGGLRVHRFSTTLDGFEALSEYSCASPPSPVAGIAGGDFNAGQTGEELVILSWGRTTGLKVHIHPTYQTTRNCDIRTSLAVEVPSTVPGEGAPVVVWPAVGHLDGDDDLDLAIGIQDVTGAPEVVVLWGNGAGRFSADTWVGHLTDGCGRPGQVLAEDIDRDGALDLLVGCWDTASVEVFLNAGDRTFEATEATLPTGLPSGAPLIALGHLDPDDILDIVAASFGGGDIAVRQGTGAVEGEDIWREPVVLPRQAVFIRAIAVSDLNGDHFDDIVIGGQGSTGGEVAVAWTVARPL
jgi:hypothetical protein